MTTQILSVTGAPRAQELTWDAINWSRVNANVSRLQMRIAQAYRDGKPGRVKALQWLLTHSRSAKLLAVKRVTENRGAKTPGVDKIVWRTAEQKMKAVTSLTRRGYQPQPLRRIYIPKKQAIGEYRPLSIPAMHCRAQQALHLLALEPVAEMMADKNAYGFRPKRSTADAIEQCAIVLSQKSAARYIFEGDIKSCFCAISHSWLLNNVPMDRAMLAKWLAAGFVENGELFPTYCGTPQGGIISPSLLTITLAGLEAAIKAVTKRQDKVHLCTYADDFVITGATLEVLEKTVRPVVEYFLAERGLALSQTKTRITPIEEGFDFLGVNIRKYKGKLLCKPAKLNLAAFLRDIRHTIKSNATAKTENLIRQLNPKIRGWANYHCHNSSKRTFSKANHYIFKSLWRWACRRHSQKGSGWIRRKYFRSKGHQHWVFFATTKDSQGKKTYLDLVEISKTPIRRHIKIRAAATPYDPEYQEYFDKRQKLRKENRLFRACKSSWSPWWEIQSTNDE
ncbi:group II intron reverse transcriptase/maturase [Legionella pneumophila serogroup 1]